MKLSGNYVILQPINTFQMHNSGFKIVVYVTLRVPMSSL